MANELIFKTCHWPCLYPSLSLSSRLWLPSRTELSGSAGVPVLLCVSTMSARNTHTCRIQRLSSPSASFHQPCSRWRSLMWLRQCSFIRGDVARTSYFTCVCNYAPDSCCSPYGLGPRWEVILVILIKNHLGFFNHYVIKRAIPARASASSFMLVVSAQAKAASGRLAADHNHSSCSAGNITSVICSKRRFSRKWLPVLGCVYTAGLSGAHNSVWPLALSILCVLGWCWLHDSEATMALPLLLYEWHRPQGAMTALLSENTAANHLILISACSGGTADTRRGNLQREQPGSGLRWRQA